MAVSTSKRFQLDGADWQKLGKGLLLAVIGAVMTYASDAIKGVDFGVYAPIAAAVWAAIANFVWKWLADNQGENADA